MNLVIDQTMSPKAIALALAAGAREANARLIAEGRASPSYRRFVDGVEGAAEEAVKPHGVILYEYSSIAEAVVFAIEFLRGRCPSGTGKYRDSFYIGVNGRMIKPANFQPRSVPLDAEIVIGNTQPYSRKIDVQLVGRRRLHFSKPAEMFNDTVRAVKRQFGNTVTAKRVYTMSFPGQYILRQEQYHLTGRYAGKSLGRAGKPVESPALIMQVIR